MGVPDWMWTREVLEFLRAPDEEWLFKRLRWVHVKHGLTGTSCAVHVDVFIDVAAMKSISTASRCADVLLAGTCKIMYAISFVSALCSIEDLTM
jgi:hypothetical protein